MGDSILPIYNTAKYGPPSTMSVPTTPTSSSTSSVFVVQGAVSTTASTVSSTSTAAATSTSAAASGNGFGYGNSSSFYRNLFYILVALLFTFGLISILSWFRTRRRRILIYQEAIRLGLLVPGMPGYAAERERVLLLMGGVTVGGGMGGRRGEGPGLWDVRDAEREKELLRIAQEEDEGKQEVISAPEVAMNQEGRYAPAAISLNPSLSNPNVYPLSVKPVVHQAASSLQPMPISTLVFFPQEHALRRPPPVVETDAVVSIWEHEGEDGLGLDAAGSGEHRDGDGHAQERDLSSGRSRAMSYPPPPGTSSQDGVGGEFTNPPQSPTSAGKRKEDDPTSPIVLARKRAIELSFLIRMPVPTALKSGPRRPREGIVPGTGEVYQENDEDDVDNAIMDEWQGAEFGVVEIPVLVDTLPDEEEGEDVAQPAAPLPLGRHPTSPGLVERSQLDRTAQPTLVIRRPGDERPRRPIARQAEFVTPTSPFGLIR